MILPVSIANIPALLSFPIYVNQKETANSLFSYLCAGRQHIGTRLALLDAGLHIWNLRPLNSSIGSP